MSAHAWMPLYVADYLADTRRLSLAEHGAYMLLIMEYWRNGGLPNDDRKLARIVGATDAEWATVRENLFELFQPGWKHKRIDEELGKARERADKASKAANKRWSKAQEMPEQCSGDANAYAQTMPSQSQSQSSSLRSEDDVGSAQAREGDFRQAVVQAYAKASSPIIPDTSRCAIWLARGHDPKICIAVIGDVLARKPSISSLAYFDQPIADAHVAPVGRARDGPGKPRGGISDAMDFLSQVANGERTIGGESAGRDPQRFPDAREPGRAPRLLAVGAGSPRSLSG